METSHVGLLKKCGILLFFRDSVQFENNINIDLQCKAQTAVMQQGCSEFLALRFGLVRKHRP
jgi:hypothetical protein